MSSQEKMIPNPFEGKKLFATERGPVLAKDVEDFERIENGFKQREYSEEIKRVLLDKSFIGPKEMPFMKTVIEELENGNPDKAINILLSPENCSGAANSDQIITLYKQVVESEKGKSLPSEKLILTLIAKEALSEKEGNMKRDVYELIQKGDLRKALFITGEYLSFLDKESHRLAEKNDPEEESIAVENQKNKELFTKIRDTLLSQIGKDL